MALLYSMHDSVLRYDSAVNRMKGILTCRHSQNSTMLLMRNMHAPMKMTKVPQKWRALRTDRKLHML